MSDLLRTALRDLCGWDSGMATECGLRVIQATRRPDLSSGWSLVAADVADGWSIVRTSCPMVVPALWSRHNWQRWQRWWNRQHGRLKWLHIRRQSDVEFALRDAVQYMRDRGIACRIPSSVQAWSLQAGGAS